MINKNNTRLTVTMPKWLVEEYKNSNYDLSKLLTTLLTNHYNFKNQKNYKISEQEKEEFKKAQQAFKDFFKEEN